jgi:hypothetical protein
MHWRGSVGTSANRSSSSKEARTSSHSSSSTRRREGKPAQARETAGVTFLFMSRSPSLLCCTCPAPSSEWVCSSGREGEQKWRASSERMLQPRSLQRCSHASRLNPAPCRPRLSVRSLGWGQQTVVRQALDTARLEGFPVDPDTPLEDDPLIKELGITLPQISGFALAA